MKTIKKLMSLGLVMIILMTNACMKSTCEESGTNSNTVYMFIDYTDQLNFNKLKDNWEKDYKTINKMYPMNACQGGKLRIIPVTNLGSNEIEAISYKALPADLNDFNPPVDYTMFKRDFKKSMHKKFMEANEEDKQ